MYILLSIISVIAMIIIGRTWSNDYLKRCTTEKEVYNISGEQKNKVKKSFVGVLITGVLFSYFLLGSFIAEYYPEFYYDKENPELFLSFSSTVDSTEKSIADEKIEAPIHSSMDNNIISDTTKIQDKNAINWDECITKTKDELSKSQTYKYYYDLDIKVKEEKETIYFTAILDDTATADNALDFADTLIRMFNSWVQVYNDSVKSAAKDYYGGIYDDYNIQIYVMPLSKVEDDKQWFINDYVGSGMHTKQEIQLEKYYMK